MSAHLTEEEQVEALKRWWAENGKSLIVAVIIGVGGYMGFGAWKDGRQAGAEEASAQYEQITELMAGQEAVSETDKATINHLAQGLKDNHADTLYGVQAAMLLAKQAVEANDLSKAEAELRWALDQASELNVELLARLRLARVLAAQAKFADALSVISVQEEASFASLYAEVRGDVFAAESKLDKAAEAYTAAIASVDAKDMARAGQLRMKLNSVQPKAADKKDV
ncbi:tetratricopeptide repeat protein [Simiduia curdlanivorans]|uniref:YfgM family protein n=1 Tax=Simiduia curdlanivorans TaxID=1492769 RepID=A0ABV8UZM6_9GAMM|nr:tetratricopeptide repeat protein [Simiduia curdlanivorans]MDN3639264.1 tetratricopeptide repeat protein [Simiduia curdlanivorans]